MALLGGWCFFALAVLVAGAETPEAAAPVRLSWTAPAECPDGPTVLGWVDALAPVEGTADATGVIDRDGSEWVLALEIVGEAKVSRTLRAPDCMVLGRAAAVVIAVSLDPIAVAQSTAVTTAIADDVAVPEPIADAPILAEPTTMPVSPRVSPPRPIDRPALAIEYGASIGVGIEGLLLPRVGPGFAIAPFVGTRRIHVEAAVQYWTPRTTNGNSTNGVQTEVQLVSAGVRACPLIERGRVRIALCAGLDAGAVIARARGGGVRSTGSASDPWAGVVLAPGVRVAVAPRVSLGFALEGVISVYMPVFEVGGLEDPVYQMGGGGLRGVLSVQIHNRRQKK